MKKDPLQLPFVFVGDVDFRQSIVNRIEPHFFVVVNIDFFPSPIIETRCSNQRPKRNGRSPHRLFNKTSPTHQKLCPNNQ